MSNTQHQTITEIRAAREEAEQEIMIAMEKFKRLTGLTVLGCQVSHVEVRRVSQVTPDVFVAGVSLTIESI